MKILKPHSQLIIPEEYNIKNVLSARECIHLKKIGGGHECITTCYEYELGSLENYFTFSKNVRKDTPSKCELLAETLEYIQSSLHFRYEGMK